MADDKITTSEAVRAEETDATVLNGASNGAEAETADAVEELLPDDEHRI